MKKLLRLLLTARKRAKNYAWYQGFKHAEEFSKEVGIKEAERILGQYVYGSSDSFDVGIYDYFIYYHKNIAQKEEDDARFSKESSAQG